MPKPPIFSSPKRGGAYPDRDLDCQMAMEDIFRAVAEQAQGAAGPSERSPTRLSNWRIITGLPKMPRIECSRTPPASSYGNRRHHPCTERLPISRR